VRRAKERLADSDLILLMLDGSRVLDENDKEILEEVKGKRKVVILNKDDLPQKISTAEVKDQFIDDPVVSISALKGKGIDDLKKTIYTALVQRDVRVTPDHLIVANIRHRTALTQIKENLSNAVKGLEEGTSFEFIAFEIRSALEGLGDLVGETTSEEILNRIFDQFCIGK
jgi:tRNA modification GTPase